MFEKQIEYGEWYVVDGPLGTEFIQAELVGDIELPTGPCEIPQALRDFCENTTADQIERRTGYGARLSAPGYLDCTSWVLFDTASEAAEYLAEFDDESEPFNLDAAGPDELAAYAADPANPIELRTYAAAKRRAVQARLAGRIAAALRHERRCERIYGRLPADLRWYLSLIQ